MLHENWFAVDKAGLGQLAERLIDRRGFGVVLGELYQNVMDTSAVECRIDVEQVPGRQLIELTVTDDNPNGFSNLEHAWTVFAPSGKKFDPTKAGRFNLGEKLVLSLCQEARIETTRGTVSFGPDGRVENLRAKRPLGTRF